MAGFEPTSLIEIDSTKLDEAQLTNLAALEAVLYGSEDTEARLPMPDEVVSIVKGDAAG
jgi:hypothetical protein